MEWEYLAPMITAVVLIVTAGGVAVLRPLSKRLGHLLEAMARERERSDPKALAELSRIREALETTHARLELLEERQDFMDQLVQGPTPGRRLPGPGGGSGGAARSAGDDAGGVAGSGPAD